ncbi:hypothetical protein ALTERO38_20117 [Alteromonas sp. 38]|nr:hypothetical protein ALTER154_100422 [Alteromonas sp. 154]VXA97943.1 hypothetical protein ALTERO38_20117 [Alteromonas sp. 38]
MSIGYVEQVISCEPNMVRWRKHLCIKKDVANAYKKLESICREHHTGAELKSENMLSLLISCFITTIKHS